MSTATHTTPVEVVRYNAATQLLDQVGPALFQREKESNIMLPLLQKLQFRSSFANSPYSVTPEAPIVDDFWLVVKSTTTGEVDFVLSCTNGPLGGYPIFIWCGRPASEMSSSFIKTRMTFLTAHLLKALPSPKRVFSIFAPIRITKQFAVEWCTLTGFEMVEDPYYNATFSSVTANTLRPAVPSNPGLPGYSLRQATVADADGVAHLCYSFAAASDPFVLTPDGAEKEAIWLISQGQAYVCEVEGVIACLVAVTRSSTNHATITKVVTHKGYLGKGWAKRLVREVCFRLLYQEAKQSVLLYVAVDNVPAERAYKSVGFSGLLGEAPEPNTDSEWLELGFIKTDLGHW